MNISVYVPSRGLNLSKYLEFLRTHIVLTLGLLDLLDPKNGIEEYLSPLVRVSIDFELEDKEIQVTYPTYMLDEDHKVFEGISAIYNPKEIKHKTFFEAGILEDSEKILDTQPGISGIYFSYTLI